MTCWGASKGSAARTVPENASNRITERNELSVRGNDIIDFMGTSLQTGRIFLS
jgi:hypothetical protein